MPEPTDTTRRLPSRGTLAVIAEMPLCRHAGGLNVHLSFGRVIDSLARRYDHVLLCMPTVEGQADAVRDYTLRGANIELVPQPPYGSSLGALKHPAGICRAYARALRRADDVFVRGMLPFVGMFYLLAGLFRRRPCHWIVGNPVALLRSHRRAGVIKDTLGLAYALQDRLFTRLGRWLTGGALLCNGEELARTFSSPRTVAVTSSTVTEEEFFLRPDTCGGGTIRILFVGFVRPEKGLEYLIEGVGKTTFDRRWELTVAGSWKAYGEYKKKLDELVSSLGIGERVKWEGYVSYAKLWEYFRTHDVFALPSLSEGTPHVLVEARASSLPIVATRVGGVPTAVKDGVDGLLVEPKDPVAIARAIDRIVTDGALRARLIEAGVQAARKQTVERFVDQVMDAMADGVCEQTMTSPE